jgi:type I restriction enzyme M protein
MRNVLIHKHSGDRPGSGLGDVEGNEAMARALVKAWFVDFEPVCYVRAEAAENDDEPFEEKMKRLVAQLREQQTEAQRLDAAIARNLQELGYGR